MALTTDIRTRVELTNTTSHNTGIVGQASTVAIIGTFPTSDTGVYSFSNLRVAKSKLGITSGTTTETDFDGSIALKRIFMDGINGYNGATKVTTVNINSTEITACDTDENGNPTTTTPDTLTYKKLEESLNKLNYEDVDILFISANMEDATTDIEDNKITDADGNQKTATIIDLYELIVEYVNNRFITQKPVYYIGAINRPYTDDNTTQDTDGLMSETINIYDSLETEEKYLESIAEVFSSETNELTTAGLFVQGGVIAGKTVDSMEMAAHICGWMCSLQVSQDLTWRTIPSVTAVSEELYFGEHDAGTCINQLGVQVIKPKDRLNNEYCVNNSINPSGWHTNHVRAVAYLLRQYGLEAGLGINNFDTNLTTFQSNLNTVTNNVINNVDIIESIDMGDIEVLTPYHIYIPLTITLYGVITIITMGVEMVLEDYNTEEEEEE